MTLGSIATGFPSLSSGGVMSKTCKTIAMTTNISTKAKPCPGHILRPWGAAQLLVSERNSKEHYPIDTHLLPNPKTKSLGSRTFGSSLPSRMKRSGRKRSG